MAKRLRIGGGAQLDGVAIKSEHFSATVRCVEGNDPHCELVEAEIETLPKWLAVIDKIPLLRGAILPLLVAWQTKGATFGEAKSKKEVSLAEKIVGLVMLFAIFAPFVWIATCFQPGLLRNLVGSAPLLFLFGGALIWARKCARDMLKYHGAEHKAIRTYDDTGEAPDADRAALRSRFHPRCGTCLIANWVALLVVLSLVFPTLPVWWMILAVLVISAELAKMARFGLLGVVSNSVGLALQGLTTIEPEEKHLRTATAAVRAVLALETAQEPPELPRTRRFKDLDELEATLG